MTSEKPSPREAFHNSSARFTHVPKRMNVYPRIFENFAPLDVLRTSNFEQWRSIGFDNLAQQGLALIFADRPDYATFVQTKTANNSTFDVMVATFPHGETPHTHTANELPEPAQSDLFRGVNATLEAIKKAADATDNSLVRIYVGEQFFFDELNDFPFKKTFEQTHIHVSGITQQDFANAKTPTYDDIYSDDQSRHVFRDPTIFVVQDLYRESFPDQPSEIDFNTASLIILKQPIGDRLEISPESRKRYVEIMEGFKQKYTEIASCFTDFHKDEYDRNLPLDRDVRVTNVSNYIAYHPRLSKNSQLILQHIAENLERFDPEKLYRAFYNNFAGHIGWTFNFEDNTVALRFAPRTFTESHGYGETDGDYFVIKDRSIRVSNEERQQVFNQQRQIIANITSLTQ